MSITYQSPYVTSQIPIYKFISDLTMGWSGIVDAKETYLPKEDKEETLSYDARQKKALYEDSFNTTIDGLTGLIFKKDIVYNEDIPSQLEPMIENADNAGNHMDIIIEKFFDTAIRKGIAFALIDIPTATEIKSKADEIKLNIRPYITLIQPENVTSWKTSNINGQTILSQVKIKEIVFEDDTENPYKLNEVEQYRVLEIGTFKIIRAVDGKEVIFKEGNTGLNYIPLVALNLNAKGFFESYPPFFDLGKLNLACYTNASDVNYSNHIANVPILKMLGFDEDELKNIVISVNKAITTTNENANIDWMSWDGAGAINSERTIARLENRMMIMGLSTITESKEITATEASITTNQKQSKLNKWVRLLNDAVELIFKHSAGFYNFSDGGSITINADILSTPLTHEQLGIMSNMNLSGQMSLELMYQIIQSGTFKLPDSFDFKTEEYKIKTQNLLPDNETKE